MFLIALGETAEPLNAEPVEGAAFFGFMGVVCALVFASIQVHQFINKFLDLGSAYGTSKSGVGICSMGVLKPMLILKSTVPVIMAGILGVYGLIVGIILA